MLSSFVRSVPRVPCLALASLTLALVLGACGSDDVGAARLKSLKGGTARAEVLSTIGEGQIKPVQPADSLRIVSGYRVSKYMADGMTHEVLWYRDSTGTMESPIGRTSDTPVVIVNDTVAGWGWKFYDKYSAAHKLPNPSKDKERLDSIYRAQQPKS
ncbi:MAG: hypothetical protein IPP90_00255 [Gemmatimonadaceae bacterium]|nr:hypothetical protein [Gemmatimonadaceae bacterium]